MERLTIRNNGQLQIAGMNKNNEVDKVFEVANRLAEYEDLGYGAEDIKKILEHKNDVLQKAFALACRLLSDFECPAAMMGTDWLECEGEADQCGDRNQWECWQKYFLERVESEPVCRVCGCTHNDACPGGCSWVEEDLCSCCSPESKE